MDGGTITLAGTALPAFTANVDVDGLGANELTVSGNNQSWMFSLDTNVTVAISGLSLIDGIGTYGGAIYSQGTLTVTDCNFTDNSASQIGGALYNKFNVMTLVGDTFSDNSAIWSGAVDNFAGGTVVVTNDTFVGNSSQDGGAIKNESGTVEVTDSTFSGNTVTSGGPGGAIDNDSTLILGNSIVAGNTASIGPDISGSINTDNGYNLIGKTDGSSGSVASDLKGTIASPLNPLLASLGNYGGPTQTMALLPGSPAIDAGSNALIPGGVTSDQRGAMRIDNGTVDIGAYEVQTLSWDPNQSNGTNLGGSGTWDTSSNDWFNGTSDVAWSNAYDPVAVFAGSAGTVTLGTGITASSLNFNTSGYTVTGNTLTLAVSGTVSVAPGDSDTISSVVAGSTGLTLTGGGTLTLSGSNTYTGGTTLSQGTLVHASNNATGAVTAPITIGDANTGSANTTLEFTAGLINNAGGTTYKPITVNNVGGTTTFVFDQGGAFADINIATSKAITLTTDASGGQDGMMGTISGTGAGAGNTTVTFSDSGGGILAYTAGYSGSDIVQNSFAGNVVIAAGNVQLQNLTYINSAYVNGDIPNTSSVTINSGATWLQVWGAQSIDGLNGSGTLDISDPATGTSNITVGASGGSGTFSGIINGSASLTKTGTGTETLSGANTYSGGTTINAGTLQVGNGGTTGSLGSGAVTDNATLFYDFSSSISLAHAIGGSGTLEVTSTGGSIAQSAAITVATVASSSSTGTTLTNAGNTISSFSAANSTSGNISLTNDPATLTITGITQSGSGTVTVTNSGGIDVTGTGISAQAGAISLTDTTGTITFDATASNGAGGITVSADVNVTLGNGSLTSTGNVTLTATTGAISESGSSIISGALLTTQAASGTTLGNSNTVTSFHASDSTSGAISLTNTASTLTVTAITQSGTAAGSDVTIAQTGALTVSGAISTTAAANGNISLTSTGGMTVSAAVTAPGSSALSLTANAAGTAAGNFIGININGVTVQSGTGAVQLDGTGGNTGNVNYGVEIHSGGVVETSGGSGTVTVMGTGGNSSGNNNYGVYVIGSGSQVTSSGGNVSVTGQGGGSGSSNTDLGMRIETGATVQAGGSGTVTVQGTGGATTGGTNYGVQVFGTGADHLRWRQCAGDWHRRRHRSGRLQPGC